MSLPQSIRVDAFLYARMSDGQYGIGYHKPDGTPLYADMRGGWTPEELRLIADDIEQRVAARKK